MKCDYFFLLFSINLMNVCYGQSTGRSCGAAFPDAPSPVLCSVQSNYCTTVSNRTASSPVNRTTGKKWFLYKDPSSKNQTRIGLTISFGANHDSSVEFIDGYRIVVQRSGNSMENGFYHTEYYCLDTKLYEPWGFFGNFSFQFTPIDQSKILKPGQNVSIFINNIPDPQTGPRYKFPHLQVNVNIPDCKNKEIRVMDECQPRFSGFTNVSCSGVVNLTYKYHVPQAQATLMSSAVVRVCKSVPMKICGQINITENLPLSGVWLQHFSDFLNNEYFFETWESKFRTERYVVSVDFDKCKIVPPEPPLTVPLLIVIIVVTLVFALVVCVISIGIRKNWNICTRIKGITTSFYVPAHERDTSALNNHDRPGTDSGANIEKKISQLEKILSENNKQRLKVYLIFVDDHPRHRDVVLKFASYLQADLQFEVIFELYQREEIYCGPVEWMTKSLEEANKVIVIWSPGATKRWIQYNNVDNTEHDMFTPVLKKIKRDLFTDKNVRKYFFAYFEYCTEEDIPPVFRDSSYCHFKLMEQFEELYFRLKGVETFMPGVVVTEEKVAFDRFFDPNLNKFGPTLETSIVEMCAYVKDYPNWHDYKNNYNNHTNDHGKIAAANSSCEVDFDSAILTQHLTIVPPLPLAAAEDDTCTYQKNKLSDSVKMTVNSNIPVEPVAATGAITRGNFTGVSQLEISLEDKNVPSLTKATGNPSDANEFAEIESFAPLAISLFDNENLDSSYFPKPMYCEQVDKNNGSFYLTYQSAMLRVPCENGLDVQPLQSINDDMLVNEPTSSLNDVPSSETREQVAVSENQLVGSFDSGYTTASFRSKAMDGKHVEENTMDLISEALVPVTNDESNCRFGKEPVLLSLVPLDMSSDPMNSLVSINMLGNNASSFV